MSGAVAVTGIGLVTPLGVGGSKAARGFPAAPAALEPELPERLAGLQPLIYRVPADYRAGRFLRRRKDLKLLARAARLAVGAARFAMEDAGLLQADATEAGLFLGVGREPGNLEDVVPALAHSLGTGGGIDLRRLAEEGMGWMNPLSALKTLPNMALAHVGISAGAMGVSQALCAGPEAGARAILEAATAILEGRAPWARAGAADARVDFTDRVAARRLADAGEAAGEPTSEAACVLVLEPLAAARARGATVLGVIEPHQGPPVGDFDRAGDCGAARAAVGLGLALSQGAAAAFAPVRLSPTLAEPPTRLAIRAGRTPQPIAITGVGLRTPLGDDLESFGRALMAGQSGAAPIRAFPAEHFPVKVACEVPHASLDPLPEGLRAAIAGLSDRKAELGLCAAWAAVADHGGLQGAERCGLAWGTGLSGVSPEELAQDCLPFIDEGGRFDFAAFGAATFPAAGPGAGRLQAPWRHRVDRPAELLWGALGLGGPRACHFSACAAGAAAIGHAVDLIRRGEAEVMIAGGADSMVHPFGMIPFILLGAISDDADPATAGRPFDRHRDGFVMGEGAAFLVLEPLARARAAGRRVHGILLGHGTSCDAHNVTAPHPEGAGAERAMRRALADAGRSPEAVGYVNAHGTGTPLNDTIEAAAVQRIFGRGVAVSSSKAQLGHAIAAAGAIETLACLAAFATGQLPPNPHTFSVDPRIEVDLVGQAARGAQVELIVSNSFGFGGQNCSLVLQHPG